MRRRNKRKAFQPMTNSLPMPVALTPNAVDAGVVRRAAVIIVDLLAAVSLLLCVPFVILAIGIPIALGLRFLLWIAGLL